MVRMHSMSHKSNCGKREYATQNACSSSDATYMVIFPTGDRLNCYLGNRGARLSYTFQ